MQNVKIEINLLGRQGNLERNETVERLFLDIIEWKTENKTPTTEEIYQSAIFYELTDAMRRGIISERDYNDLWHHLHHGCLQPYGKNQRVGLKELDQSKNATCYGRVETITEDSVMISDVYIEGISNDDQLIIYRTSHVWLRSMGIRKAIEENKVWEGVYIRFKGKPYIYKRRNGTEDLSFKNTNNKKIRVIDKSEYLKKWNGVDEI